MDIINAERRGRKSYKTMYLNLKGWMFVTLWIIFFLTGVTFYALRGNYTLQNRIMQSEVKK